MLTTERVIDDAITRQREVKVTPIECDGRHAEWHAMFDRDPTASPLQHPDYLLAELDAMTSPAKLSPTLIRVGTETDCEGLGVLLPKTVRTGQVGGIGPGWSLFGLRLAGEGFHTNHDAPEVLEKLLNAAMAHCREVGAAFLLIEDLDEQSSLNRAVQQEVRRGCHLFTAREVQARWRIDFFDHEEDYWKTFSSRTRRAFRSNLKKCGQNQLVRVTDVEQVPEFLSAAHEISKRSWQSRQFGLRIRNDQSELRRLSILAQQGFLRSYLWTVENRPAAFALCHQRNGYFRYEEVAYCADFSRLSPGVTALQQIIEDLYRHDPPKCLDFGGGDAEYKRQFGNRESRSQTVWLVPSTWRAGTTLAYLNGCRGARSLARQTVKSFGLATKARQWLRYGGRFDHAKAKPTTSSEQATTSSEEVGK